MNNNLPPCPVESVDRDTVRNYLERNELLDEKIDSLRARTFGRRVFRSFQLRSAIAQLKSIQSQSRNIHPDLLSNESLEAYTTWVEVLSGELEQY